MPDRARSDERDAPRKRLVTHLLHLHRISHCRCLVSQECHRHHVHDQRGTQSGQLCPGLHLLMVGESMEVRVQGQCMYAKRLDDTEF